MFKSIKISFAILISIFLVVSQNLSAEENTETTTYLHCSNNEWGDAELEVDVFEDGITVQLYETSVPLDATMFDVKTTDDGSLYKRAADKTVEIFSEGDSYIVNVTTALIIISKDKKSLTLDINIDGGETTYDTFQCNYKTVPY